MEQAISCSAHLFDFPFPTSSRSTTIIISTAKPFFEESNSITAYPVTSSKVVEDSLQSQLEIIWSLDCALNYPLLSAEVFSSYYIYYEEWLWRLKKKHTLLEKSLLISPFPLFHLMADSFDDNWLSSRDQKWQLTCFFICTTLTLVPYCQSYWFFCNFMSRQLMPDCLTCLVNQPPADLRCKHQSYHTYHSHLYLKPKKIVSSQASIVAFPEIGKRLKSFP